MPRVPSDPPVTVPTPAAPTEPTPNSKSHLDEELDEALEETFPASDPVPWTHRDD